VRLSDKAKHRHSSRLPVYTAIQRQFPEFRT